MPDESHTLIPGGQAANRAIPPATSTQPGRARVIDPIKEVAAIRAASGCLGANYGVQLDIADSAYRSILCGK